MLLVLVVRALTALPHVFEILGTRIRKLLFHFEETLDRITREEESTPLAYSFRVSVLITRRVAWYWQQKCGNGPGG